MSDLCPACQGGQHFFVSRPWLKQRWWSCPCCSGVGTLRCHADVHVRGPKIQGGLGKKLIAVAREMAKREDRDWRLFLEQQRQKFITHP